MLISYFLFCFNIYWPKICLHSEGVKIKVGGFLTYTILALFFVHWTTIVLLVTGCQEKYLWKNRLAPQRQAVIRFSVTCCTPTRVPLTIPACSDVMSNYLLLCHKSISRCNGNQSLICRNIYGSAFKGAFNPQLQLMKHVARTVSKTMWAKMSSYKAVKT